MRASTALAMVGLTLFVLAMIASYSGAFANPMLHHMTVAVAGPERLVDGIRDQDSLAVNEVGDAAAARQQVYERKSDAAFVMSPAGEMKIYVAGGGGKSVASARSAERISLPAPTRPTTPESGRARYLAPTTPEAALRTP